MADRRGAAPTRSAALKRTLAARITIVIALVGVGCTTAYADPIDAVTPGPATLPGAVIAAPGSALGADDLFCTYKRPIEGASCSFPGAACEYGGSPDLTCDAIVDCLGVGNGESSWSTRAPNPECVPHDCPSSYGDIVAGSPCDIDIDGAPAGDSAEYLCAYDQGTCGCTTGVDGAHAHARQWECTGAASFVCPKQRPAIGTACSGTMICDYGSCLFKHGTAVECAGSHWLATVIDCP
jgi:hypothetical protein